MAFLNPVLGLVRAAAQISPKMPGNSPAPLRQIVARHSLQRRSHFATGA